VFLFAQETSSVIQRQPDALASMPAQRELFLIPSTSFVSLVAIIKLLHMEARATLLALMAFTPTKWPKHVLKMVNVQAGFSEISPKGNALVFVTLIQMVMQTYQQRNAFSNATHPYLPIILQEVAWAPVHQFPFPTA
jgi:hypothetical protein